MLLVLKWLFIMLGVAALGISIYLLFTDIPAISVITIFMTVGFLAIANISSKQANSFQIYRNYLEVKENGLYYLYENDTHQAKEEHYISYNQVKTMYLARGTQMIYDPGKVGRNSIVYPILIMEWDNGDEKRYLSQGMSEKEFRKVLDLIPMSIPLKALEYNLTHCPISLIPKVIEHSDLINVDREVKHLELPFPISGRVSTIPTWEPPEQREGKVERDNRSKGIAKIIVGCTVIVIFLLINFTLPHVTLEDGMFRTEDTLYMDLLYGIVLLLFVFIRHHIIYNDLYPLKKAIFHILLIAGIYIVGGLVASFLQSVPHGFMDAIVVQAVLAAIIAGATYIVYLFIAVLILIIDMLKVRK